MGIRCADHVTPLYPQKLALTSPTGGGSSVGIVRSQTKATEFNIKVDRKYTRWENVSLHSYVLGYGPVVGCCEQGDEIVGFVEGGGGVKWPRRRLLASVP